MMRSMPGRAQNQGCGMRPRIGSSKIISTPHADRAVKLITSGDPPPSDVSRLGGAQDCRVVRVELENLSAYVISRLSASWRSLASCEPQSQSRTCQARFIGTGTILDINGTAST